MLDYLARQPLSYIVMYLLSTLFIIKLGRKGTWVPALILWVMYTAIFAFLFYFMFVFLHVK